MDLNLCLKVLDAEQIRQADQFTIKNEPIHSIDLMERASEEFVHWYVRNFEIDWPVVVFCGPGNNGGDGLVICRLLNDLGYSVSLFCIGDPEKSSRDFKINFDYIQNYDLPQTMVEEGNFPSLSKKTVIIDAIFGSGLSRAVTGLYADLIDHLNQEPCEYRVAVDIASGLGCNQRFEGGSIMLATHTFSFQVPKLSLLLPDNEPYSGELTIRSIGLVEEYIQSLASEYYYTTEAFIQSFLIRRGKFSHKGTVGKNLLVVGGEGKMGAAILAARACLRAGAGLVTLHIPGCGRDVLQSSVPEAMVAIDPNNSCISNPKALNQYDVIGVGPGIGTEKVTVNALKTILKAVDRPMLLDADAINILGENKKMIPLIPKGSVLTPHPGEFERLVGEWKDDYERLEKQISFCKAHQVVLLLKGANTSICHPGGTVIFNPTGNPGMATGGSGDVLSGMITALLGQGYTGFESAILGAYWHGLAGDLFARKNAFESLTASDLVEYLPKAIKKSMRKIHVKKRTKKG